MAFHASRRKLQVQMLVAGFEHSPSCFVRARYWGSASIHWTKRQRRSELTVCTRLKTQKRSVDIPKWATFPPLSWLRSEHFRT